MRRESGMSLIELIVSMGTATVVLGIIATIYVSVIDYHVSLMNRMEAEENLYRASYYVRTFLGQALKTRCQYTNHNVNWDPTPTELPRPGAFSGGYAAIATPYVAPPPDNLTVPNGVAHGVVDCRTRIPGTGNDYIPDTYNPIAIFNREFGVGNGATAASSIMSTGIYFIPATATQSGRLVLVSNRPGTALTPQTPAEEGIILDKFSYVSILAGSVSESLKYKSLETLTMRLVTRYFIKNQMAGVAVSANDYRPNGTAVDFMDLTNDLTIGFRNNVLSVSTFSGAGNNIRLHGGIYYYRLIVPPTLIGF